MDKHWVLISLKDVVVNVSMIFFDHQLADKFVELNRINLYERLNQEHPNLLDHIEMLFKKKQIPFDFRLSFNFLYLLRQMHRLYDL